MLRPDGGGWLVQIDQLGVSRCIVDHGLTLHFGDDEVPGLVRIGGAFTLGDEQQFRTLTSAAPGELGPVLGLLGQVVVSATISEAGRLTIVFANRQVLAVDPDPKYEAWELHGADGWMAVCAPGGEIAVWEPERTEKPPR